MEKAHSIADIDSLKQWSINFIKHKDMLAKSIVKITEKRVDSGVMLDVLSKKTNFSYLVAGVFCLDALHDIHSFFDNNNNTNLSLFVVLFNTSGNINLIYKNWDSLVSYAGLTLIFVNPKNNSYFALKPYIHNKISDKSSLKKGLSSMAESAGLMK